MVLVIRSADDGLGASPWDMTRTRIVAAIIIMWLDSACQPAYQTSDNQWIGIPAEVTGKSGCERAKGSVARFDCLTVHKLGRLPTSFCVGVSFSSR